MSAKSLHILFRVDSSSKIGLGHTMRCLTLAQRLRELRPEISIAFALQELQGNINEKISLSGFELIILHSNKVKELTEIVNQNSFNLIIIDSYKLDYKFEKKLKQKTSCKLLVFDDMFNLHTADIVLNHGFQVKKTMYKNLLSKNTKIFCGAKYTILRDEFFQKYKKTDTADKIAILLGGNDIRNLSLRISKLLKKINKNYQVSIITTSVNPHLPILQSAKDIELFIDLPNVAEVLAQQNIIICASGGTLFEVMAMKKKFINVQVANNQSSIVEFLNKNKIFTSLKQKNISKKNLLDKLNYVSSNTIYENLDLKFSKDHLAKQILKELV